jgi:hypothetical protein
MVLTSHSFFNAYGKLFLPHTFLFAHSYFSGAHDVLRSSLIKKYAKNLAFFLASPNLTISCSPISLLLAKHKELTHVFNVASNSFLFLTPVRDMGPEVEKEGGF